MHGLDDLLHAGLDVVESGDIHLAGATLAEIGEPQAPLPVEHEIVRSAQAVLAAFVDHGLELAALQVDALDRTAAIIFGLRARHDHVAGRNPGEAAIVADVHLAIGTERGAVRAARNLRDDLLAAVGMDPRQPLPADFDQHDRAVRHHHRAFRKFQTGGEHANIGHDDPPACSQLQAGDPAQASCCLTLWQRRPRLPSKRAPWLRCG